MVAVVVLFVLAIVVAVADKRTLRDSFTRLLVDLILALGVFVFVVEGVKETFGLSSSPLYWWIGGLLVIGLSAFVYARLRKV